MDALHFILENPHPNASDNKQPEKKRARLVTACDSCRIKRRKCHQPSPNADCEACKAAKIPCLFGDRDRYQAERGVACNWNPTTTEDALASLESSSRKRKLNSVSSGSALPDLWRPSSSSSSTRPSRPTTPAGGSLPTYRYLQTTQHTRPSSASSFMNRFDVFPPTNAIPPMDNSSAISYENVPLFDPARPRFPHPQRLRHLAVLFFDNIASHFPFLERYDVLHRIEKHTCSAILSNCIAALAARFVDPAHPDSAAGAPFYDMAKTLAPHAISLPSVDALHALICITWAEYGAGHNNGFWMYSRMAIAMCLDLGLGNEATIRIAATSEVRSRLRITWWSVVCTADIAAAWAFGRATTIDLSQFDTALPRATDDVSMIFRHTTELFVLRARLTRVLDAHVENPGESSLDWDLSELQADLKNMSKGLPASVVFNEENNRRLQERGIGHLLVHMHLLINALSALVNRPSILPSYAIPVPTRGPRAETARTCAKAIVDILALASNTTPHALHNPFMDLPVLVASRTFLAESDTEPCVAMTMSPRSNQLARQWSDTSLNKCKDALVQLSSVWGGDATFDSILEKHGGTLDDFSASCGGVSLDGILEKQRGTLDDIPGSSSLDLFTGPNNSHNWLLHPALVDDGASDTSSSFRSSSSQDYSPRLAPMPNAPSKFLPFPMGVSPLVQGVDDAPGLELVDMNNLSFRASEFFVPDFANG